MGFQFQKEIKQQMTDERARGELPPLDIPEVQAQEEPAEEQPEEDNEE